MPSVTYAAITSRSVSSTFSCSSLLLWCSTSILASWILSISAMTSSSFLSRFWHILRPVTSFSPWPCTLLAATSASSNVLRSLYFAPITFAIPGDRTTNLTTILITTDHYTSYPKYRPWPRLSHSLMAVHLMITSWQTLHHAYRRAMHLGTSCISSLLYDPYLHLMLIPCTPHDSPSSYRVWSTYLGYAPHGFLMYYSTGHL